MDNEMSFTEKKRQLFKTIETIEVRTDFGIAYLVFKNTPEAIKLKKEHEGKRVWISSEPRTTKAWLRSFNGDEVRIKYQNSVDRDFLVEEVILHPKEWRGLI